MKNLILASLLILSACGKDQERGQNGQPFPQYLNENGTQQARFENRRATSLQRYWTPVLKFDGRTCLDEARDLQARFESATGIKVFSSECSHSTEEVHYVTLSYLAESELSIGSMEFGWGGRSNSIYYSRLLKNDGIYPDRASCISDIEKRKNEFEKLTGSIPLAINCFRDSGIVGPKHYVLSLDYLYLKVKSHLQTLDLYFDAELHPEYAKAMVKRLGERGDVIVHQDVNAILFYGFGPFYVRNDRIGGWFESQAHCEKESANHRETMKSLGFTTVIDGCFPDSIKRIYLVSFSERVKDTTSMKETLSSKKYTSYEECTADRPAVIEFYRTQLKEKVQGGVCSRDHFSDRTTLLLFGFW